MDPTSANNTVTAGQPIGTMGGRGEYTKEIVQGYGTTPVSVYWHARGVPAMPVPGNPQYGPNAYQVHVHYDIFLPDDVGGRDPAVSHWDWDDNRIDPIAYWTTGVNPSAPDGASPDNPDPLSRATGLTVLATPVTASGN